MKTLLFRYSIAAVALALLGFTAFGLTRYFADPGAGSEATGRPAPAIEPEQIVATIEAGKQKPRFVGELAGVFIAPTPADWPAALREAREERLAGGCRAASRDRAAHLDLRAEPDLPGFQQSPPEPQVIECSGSVTSINREYVGTAANGGPATILLTRSVSRALGIDAAEESVSVTTIDGRTAILIRPVSPDGTGQTSNIIFPEDFGTTTVYAFNLSEPELIRVAEAVAAATK
ncbi:MAG TPA: hypothetical protein VNM91_08660 [Dehalococcoidia bacterium]|nr:hypothetical protein [Dehalococcoidia bacterium]